MIPLVLVYFSFAPELVVSGGCVELWLLVLLGPCCLAGRWGLHSFCMWFGLCSISLVSTIGFHCDEKVSGFLDRLPMYSQYQNHCSTILAVGWAGNYSVPGITMIQCCSIFSMLLGWETVSEATVVYCCCYHPCSGCASFLVKWVLCAGCGFHCGWLFPIGQWLKGIATHFVIG